MLGAVDASPYEVYAIGVGHEIDDWTLSRLGKSGNIRVEDSSASSAALHEIGERILRAGKRYYPAAASTFADAWRARKPPALRRLDTVHASLLKEREGFLNRLCDAPGERHAGPEPGDHE